jgi:hypothetical protein
MGAIEGAIEADVAWLDVAWREFPIASFSRSTIPSDAEQQDYFWSSDASGTQKGLIVGDHSFATGC